MKKKISTDLFISTWFRSGLIRPILLKGMAGTYGSFFALPLCIPLILLSKISLIFFIATFAIYLWICFAVWRIGIDSIPAAEEELGPCKDWKGKIKERDQNQIVIDEVFGMLITCFPLFFFPELYWYHFGIAFGLFRFFDIVKIWPVNYFDKKKNAFGVMMDDGIAGAYSAIFLCIIHFLFLI